MSHPQLGKVGLLLAGGGARGVYTQGYLKAWQELGFEYDVIYGSSVGALCGALFHQKDYDKLDWLWNNVKTEDVYKIDMWSILGAFGKKASLFDSSPLAKTIDKLLDYDKLVANPKDFWINATDVTNWEPYSREVKTLKNKQEVATLLRGSASPPIAFEPITFDNRQLVDAGLVNNFSITQATHDKCDTLVIMTPTRVEPQPIRNVLDQFSLLTSVPEYNYFARELKCVTIINTLIEKVNESLEPDYRPIKIVIVKPPAPTGIDLLKFEYKDRKALIDHGYNIAKEILQKELM